MSQLTPHPRHYLLPIVARPVSTARPACSISRATTFGCERKGTWLDLTSTGCAPMRLARERSSSGLMVRSSCATQYHDGMDFQAGLGTDAAKTVLLTGFCVTAITRASAASGAKAATTSSCASVMDV